MPLLPWRFGQARDRRGLVGLRHGYSGCGVEYQEGGRDFWGWRREVEKMIGVEMMWFCCFCGEERDGVRGGVALSWCVISRGFRHGVVRKGLVGRLAVAQLRFV